MREKLSFFLFLHGKGCRSAETIAYRHFNAVFFAVKQKSKIVWSIKNRTSGWAGGGLFSLFPNRKRIFLTNNRNTSGQKPAKAAYYLVKWKHRENQALWLLWLLLAIHPHLKVFVYRYGSIRKRSNSSGRRIWPFFRTYKEPPATRMIVEYCKSGDAGKTFRNFLILSAALASGFPYSFLSCSGVSNNWRASRSSSRSDCFSLGR